VATDPRQLRPDELPINLKPEMVEEILKSGRHETIVAMVGRRDMPPAMIHEISKHKAPDIRLAVARNPAVADGTLRDLAKDPEAKIRTATVPTLVERLSPTASTKPTSKDKQFIKSLEKLAEDELASVRRQVTQSIMKSEAPPAALVNTLAQDLDRLVAEPILTGASNLDDKILQQVIENYPPPWVLKAVAQRKQLGPKITHEIVEHRDAEAAGMILDNDGAVIDDASFGIMVDMAQENEALQAPLATHPALPKDDAVRLAYFAGERILTMLKKAQKIDPREAKRLAKIAARELNKTARQVTFQDAVDEARRLEEQGRLNTELLVENFNPENPSLVIGALAYRARTHPLIVKRIIESDSAKGIVAITWRASFKMPLAETIMEKMGNVPSNKRLKSRPQGAFPMTPPEMVWYLEFFGIEEKAALS